MEGGRGVYRAAALTLAVAGVAGGALLSSCGPQTEPASSSSNPAAPVAVAPAQAGRSPVLVLVDPPGASVFVDGREVGIAGVDGLYLDTLDPKSEHRIRVSIEGREPVEASLPAREPGKPRVLRLLIPGATGEVVLRQGCAGTIVVASRPGHPPRDIPFLADGTLGPFRFDAGEYEFTLSRPGFVTRREAVRVDAGAVVELDVDLVEKDGMLSLDSEPAGAVVEMDDEPLGAAPLSAIPVPAGTHRIRLLHPDADELRQDVTIRGESLADLGTLRLPPLAVLDLTGLPDGVRATVDGAPASGKVRRKAGAVVVVLSREGFLDQNVALKLQGGKETAPKCGAWNDVPGRLDASRIPPDVILRVNGRETPRPADGHVAVPPGSLRVSLDGPGLGTASTIDIDVAPGGVAEVPPPSWKPREIRPAMPGLASPPRQDRAGVPLPPAFVEQGGRILCVRDGAEAVILSAGEFTMGSDDAPSEKPARKVSLPSILMDRHEVTIAQFAEFAAATGYVTDAERAGWSNDGDREGTRGFDWRHPDGPVFGIAGRETLPVTLVSWNDARAYAAWAGKRLPTEAEFERAIRGGRDGRKFAWGDEVSPPPRAGNLLDEFGHAAHPRTKGWIRGYKDGFAGTAPAGSFASNPFGLFDVVGNVTEWCADGYDAKYYAAAPTADPRGPDPANCRHRVHRGGSWSSEIQNLHCSNRGYQLPGARWTWLGFRCAADLAPAAGR